MAESAMAPLLVLMTILCLVLVVACYYLMQSRQDARIRENAVNQVLLEEKRVRRLEQRKLEKALQSTGGIAKRLSESAEIAEAIETHAPALFSQHPSLAYLLRANDEFLVELYKTVSKMMGPELWERVQEMEKQGRSAVFERAIDAARKRPPTPERPPELDDAQYGD